MASFFYRLSNLVHLQAPVCLPVAWRDRVSRGLGSLGLWLER